MLVCHCKRVCEETIRDRVRQGARTIDEVAAACQAGTGCGGCRPLIEVLVDEETGAGDGSAAPFRLPIAS